MRILAFTDTHGEIAAAEHIVRLFEQFKPDLVVSSGDISVFGAEYEAFMERLREMEQSIYFVPGNHEPGETGKRIESMYPFLTNVSFRMALAKGVQIIGLPGIEDIAPGAREDESLHSLALELWKGLDRSIPVLMLTHYPPRGTRCDGLKRKPGDPKPIDLPSGDGGGSKVARRIVESLQPDIVVTGHYHSCFGEEDRLGKSWVVNPGPQGRVLEARGPGRIAKTLHKM